MKQVLLLLVFLPFLLFSQTTESIMNHNNVHAILLNNGILFNNYFSGGPGYFVPKEDVTSVLYSTHLVSYGFKNDTLKGAGNNYSSASWQAGPVASNYNGMSYSNKYGTSIWKISKAEIQAHNQNWEDASYTIPNAILRWPGNGNTSNGEAAILAPFVDMNNNHIYEPHLGDFPSIRGDYATYIILNDDNNVSSLGDPESLGQELHVMVYQFTSFDPVINNTTFINFKLFNRSNLPFEDLIFGLVNDYDLGNPHDDYIGCDSDLALSYVYNGDAYDEDGSMLIGYGANPPAFGFVELNGDLFSHVRFPNFQNSMNGFYYNLAGYQPNGNPIITNDGTETPYQYDDDEGSSNSEMAMSNIPSDRRATIGTEMEDLFPGEYLCRDFALVYGRSNAFNSGFESVYELKNNTIDVIDFYDNHDYECEMHYVGINNLEKEYIHKVYPNPAQHEISIEGLFDYQYTIRSVEGKIIQSGKVSNGVLNIENLEKGMYHLQINGAVDRTFIKG